jgi:hypothetical protein
VYIYIYIYNIIILLVALYGRVIWPLTLKEEHRLTVGIVVNALCYKPEGRGSETRGGEWFLSIYLILPAALGPGVYSASNRNEYRKHKMFLGSKATAGA